MRLIFGCALFTVLITIISIAVMDNGAAEADLLVLLSPLGVALGAWTAWRGMATARPFGGMIGIVQIAYWPLVAFVLQVTGEDPYWAFVRQVLLGLLILAYVVATAALLTIHLLKGRQQPQSTT